MKKLYFAAAALLAMASPALAMPTAVGNLVISAFLAVGIGTLLPAASANAFGNLAVDVEE